MDKRVFLGVAEEDNTVWFFHPQANLIMQIKIPEMRIITERAVKNWEFSFVPLAYSDACIWKQYIIFSPWNAKEILVYDRKNDTITTIPFQADEFGNAYFLKILKFKNSIYFIPCCYNAVLEFDLNSNALSYHYQIVKENTNNYKGVFCEPVYRDLTAILGTAQNNKLIFFNMLTRKQEKIIHVGGCRKGLRSIEKDEKYLYIVPRFEYKIYIIELENNQKIYEIELEMTRDQDKEYFTNIFNCGTYLFLVQRFGDKSYIIEKESWKAIPFSLFNNNEILDQKITYSYKINEKYILIVLANNNTRIGIFDIEKRSIVWREFSVWEKEIMLYNMQNRILNQKILIESKENEVLEDFQKVLKYNVHNNFNECIKDSYGKLIYESLSKA